MDRVSRTSNARIADANSPQVTSAAELLTLESAGLPFGCVVDTYFVSFVGFFIVICLVCFF